LCLPIKRLRKQSDLQISYAKDLMSICPQIRKNLGELQMSINSILKKEGISVKYELDGPKFNTIIKNVYSRLSLAFPEHNLNRGEVLESLSRLNLYAADMPGNLGGAKYFPKNNSIYFCHRLSAKKIANIVMHECIHFIQESKDHKRQCSENGLI